MYYQRNTRRRDHSVSAHPRIEFWVTVIVLVAVIAALGIFLLVYHDVPFRPGGGFA